MLKTPNILGKIEGKNKNSGCIILSSHIDGAGSYPDGFYYPESAGSASDTALILELAKTIKSQKNLPDKTIIFAIWNNEEYGMRGKEYYSQNPAYPLNKSDIIYFENFGSNQFNWYSIGNLNDDSGNTGMALLKDRLNQYFMPVTPVNSTNSFKSSGSSYLPEISIEASIKNPDFIYTKENGINSISINQLKYDAGSIIQYIKKEIYGDIIGNLLNNIEKSFLYLLILSLIFIYIISKLNILNPDIKIFHTRVENIYYSSFYGIFERLVFYILQGSLILVSVVMVSFIPHNFNLFFINGKLKANFSLNQVLDYTVSYIRMLFTKGFGKVYSNFNNSTYNVSELISYSFIRSFLLLLTATVFSVIAGTLKGIHDGFINNKNVSLGSIGTLILFSIPDVMIVVLIQFFFVFLNNHNLLTALNSYREFKRFLVSFLSLVILPSVYITRIASTAANEESKKEYIKMARAKGLSNYYIIKNHLFINVFIKVIDSLPSVLNLMISNLIVVEYLYYYPGIVYNLMLCYSKYQAVAFAGLAITLSVLYIVFLAIFNAISIIVNPLKREGIR
jgi:ABC-type dipeptide/oligopeptide/nickel transport system permease component